MHGIIVLNRNGNRRPTTRRRRKKASPFKTITLWILFLVFTLSATVFFLLLVYLDLVSNNKNSRELALCCGAFGVSLLTALRIWVSLPDELGTDHHHHHLGTGASLARRTGSQVSPCNCSTRGPEAASTTEYQQDVELLETAENYLLLPESLESQSDQIENMHPPSYNDCLTGLSKSYLETEEDSILPPTYSSLNLCENISSTPPTPCPPPHYEEALKISI